MPISQRVFTDAGQRPAAGNYFPNAGIAVYVDLRKSVAVYTIQLHPNLCVFILGTCLSYVGLSVE